MIFLLKPKLSYFRKQLVMIIVINFLSIAIVSGVLYTNFVNDYQDNLVNGMASKLSMLSASTSSAILFDDSERANELLASMSESPNTRFVQLFNVEHLPFASYVRDGVNIDVSTDELKIGNQFLNDNLYLYQHIHMDGESLGYILLSAGTDELKAQQSRYAQLVAIIFVVSLLFAYGLNWRIQTLMFSPINRLLDLVTYVAEKRRYHRRLSWQQDDEIGGLVKGVNSMLDTIETHEKQLKDNSERLESLVTLRTEQLFQRANYDALTQLPNRHLLIDRLNHAIDNAEREDTKLALMFLDLDRFKVINDSLGHSVGDQLLCKVAEKLSSVVRKSDSVCRWGGDEFVILLEHFSDTTQAKFLAEQITNVLSEPMSVSGHQLHVSTSIGISVYPGDGLESGSLLKNADISMYRAKDQGPGKFCFFDASMLSDSMHRMTLEGKLRKAFEQNEFFIVYQPQICLISTKLCGIEALIRWDDDGTTILPNNFLPVLEEIGMMGVLSEWVLKEVCKQNAGWLSLGANLPPVAVNLTASFIVQPNCAELIESILIETGLPAHHLEIEITENTFVSSTEMAIKTLEKLKGMHVGIAIDDFGTGYSCMSYLRDLPISKLKIDGSFIQHIGESRVTDGIVKSIITLGRSLELVVVGECIETDQQNHALKEMGCDLAQGYLHSTPLSAHEMGEYLKHFVKSNEIV